MAIYDFITGNYNFDNNLSKIKKFRLLNLSFNKNSENKILKTNEINYLIKDKYLISNMLFSKVDLEKFNFFKSISDFFNNGCVIGGYLSPLYPIFMLSKNIISIDEFYPEVNSYEISIIKNNPQYFKIGLSFLIALLFFIIIFPIIIIKGMYVYFNKFI